ncbi:helix-turn-helix transcriptional regulator [Acinetobacter sp. CFCC 10889]|uniref:helix-turn-helix transcriptional regulator n=1 Tax=Acinetobacter sp. CFCC 10889 TaxID=1775557 RepID=UPI001D1873E5|nr:LuxR C-terminal-related transcriptional regulator [Acinetobacter sp. CFCC 10889]
MNLLENEKNDVYHILDHFKFGVMLINQDMQLKYTNSLAKKILENTDLLKLDKNNYLKTLKQYQGDLNYLINNALSEDFNLLNKNSGLLAIKHDTSEESLLLTVLPFKTLNTLNHQKKVMIFISQINQLQSLAKEYLIQRYKLAKRELLFCELFVNGQRLEQITENMNITYGTARMYIKNIFAKTGCTSQTELMQLLMCARCDFEQV